MSNVLTCDAVTATGNHNGPIPSLACPPSNWYVTSDSSSSQHVVAPLLPYQAAILAFLVTLCIVIILTCFQFEICRKNTGTSAEVTAWIPIWARRKSSAYHLDSTMQTWDLERNSTKHEPNSRDSNLESTASSFQPCVKSIHQADFRSVIDSVMLVQRESVAKDIMKEIETYAPQELGSSAGKPMHFLDAGNIEILLGKKSQQYIAELNSIYSGKQENSPFVNFCCLKQGTLQRQNENFSCRPLYDNVVKELEQSFSK